ncbi:hypothetical protein Y032_0003g1245 [Ancylostoma ceylanicum]|uniref:Mos1 transposase HTH domain-containing protein n=1 Tax=Ancylostoma ceylanicum TaxID=53326 RepID=A0A016VXN5_9BILA|nr:hypothetical protein Y032_0003g1245 [Ancylostoma ceylanicum]
MMCRRNFWVIMLYEFKLNHSAAEAAHTLALDSEVLVRKVFFWRLLPRRKTRSWSKEIARRSSTESSRGVETRYYHSGVGSRPRCSSYYSCESFGLHWDGKKDPKVDTP